jgi:hypothetical protein
VLVQGPIGLGDTQVQMQTPSTATTKQEKRTP